LFASVLRSFLAFVIGASEKAVAIQVLLCRPLSSDRRADELSALHKIASMGLGEKGTAQFLS